MNTFATLKGALLHLLYPHICAGCGIDTLPFTSQLCLKCLHHLPVTGFEKHPDNPIEKLLTGRVVCNRATAQFYFTKHSVLQKIMHQFKYRGNKELGYQLGVLMGSQLLETNRFSGIDALIPLPLHESKERKRGYNQAEILCRGIAEILQIPVLKNMIIRIEATETQTRKSRIKRWQNMKGKFELCNREQIENKQVLLVDDVITTGATLESCAQALAGIKGIGVNIATLCYASKI